MGNRLLSASRLAGACACVVAVAVGGAACGQDDRPGQSGATQQTNAAAGGGDLQLVRLDDLRKLDDGSPERAVLTLWYWAQWGSIPNVVDAYAPSVRDAIGARRIAGSFTQQRESMKLLRPEIKDVSRTEKGALVTTLIRPRGAAPVPDSWLLRRREGRWQVVHDTFLERSVASFVQSVVQESVDPEAREPSRRAEAAGRRARNEYQRLFLGERPASRPQRATSGAATSE